jgi:hypothetical protein
MLPDLLIDARELWGAEEATYLRAWDIPAYWFLYEIPADALPGAVCFDRLGPAGRRENLGQWERWFDALFERVLTDPSSLPVPPGGLGTEGRDRILVTYFRAIGWLPEGPLGLPVVTVPHEAAALRRRLALLLEPRTWVPPSALLEGIGILSARCRLDAWRLCSRPISEWLWLYNVHAKEFMLKKQRAAGGGLDVSPEIAAIGITD